MMGNNDNWHAPQGQARKEMWERRQAKRTQRSGNFDITEDRFVYRPI
jgi:hypothetical protein